MPFSRILKIVEPQVWLDNEWRSAIPGMKCSHGGAGFASPPTGMLYPMINAETILLDVDVFSP
jgi:hypothetical protein